MNAIILTLMYKLQFIYKVLLTKVPIIIYFRYGENEPKAGDRIKVGNCIAIFRKIK